LREKNVEIVIIFLIIPILTDTGRRHKVEISG